MRFFSSLLLSVAVSQAITSVFGLALAAPVAELKIETSGRVQTVSLAELRKKLAVATVTVNDPVYKRSKTYEGFWLTDVLRAVGVDTAGADELVFHCLDGYSPSMPFSLTERKKGLLAFREKGVKGGWESVRMGKAVLTPAPFYLVWDTTDEAFPWPFQLVGIEVVRVKAKYDRIFPEGLSPTSSVYRGFETFRTKCLRCHSLNLQGGDVGPELNIPQNITEYWDEKILRRFIRNPGEYRAKSKMPAFPQLKDEELDAVLDYLKWMRGKKTEAVPF